MLESLRAEIAFDQCGLSLPLTLELEVATYKLPARKAELSHTKVYRSVPGECPCGWQGKTKINHHILVFTSFFTSFFTLTGTL